MTCLTKGFIKMESKVYFDNAATTPIDPRVLDEMMPYLTKNFGNASSLHSFGTEAKDTLEKCRVRLATLLRVSYDEVIFTSSGTEANNLALKGVAFANKEHGNHIIVSSIEHDCILNACKWLEKQGFFVTYLPVDRFGMVNPDELRRYITPKTILVSVMQANNEIGTIQPLHEIGAICKERNIYFHSDACQSFGKVPLNIHEMNIDLLTLNSHKIFGPKGVGVLIKRDGVRISPWLHGGGQEFGIRSSTENIAGIVGFVKAVELCVNDFEHEVKRLTILRDKLIYNLFENVDGIYLNGHPTNRLPNNVNIGISGFEGETIRLLLLLDDMGIAVSAGSACSSNDKSSGASHVLQAIGLNQFEARGSIRISLGRFNTEDEVDRFTDVFKSTVGKLSSIFS